MLRPLGNQLILKFDYNNNNMIIIVKYMFCEGYTGCSEWILSTMELN